MDVGCLMFFLEARHGRGYCAQECPEGKKQIHHRPMGLGGGCCFLSFLVSFDGTLGRPQRSLRIPELFAPNIWVLCGTTCKGLRTLPQRMSLVGRS